MSDSCAIEFNYGLNAHIKGLAFVRLIIQQQGLGRLQMRAALFACFPAGAAVLFGQIHRFESAPLLAGFADESNLKNPRLIAIKRGVDLV